MTEITVLADKCWHPISSCDPNGACAWDQHFSWTIASWPTRTITTWPVWEHGFIYPSPFLEATTLLFWRRQDADWFGISNLFTYLKSIPFLFLIVCSYCNLPPKSCGVPQGSGLILVSFVLMLLFMEIHPGLIMRVISSRPEAVRATLAVWNSANTYPMTWR